MKVRAKGPKDVCVGYYGHLRRRGGDVFTLVPVTRMRKNKETLKMEPTVITAEMQFSERWMERVSEKIPETKPGHFNKVGRGDARRVKENDNPTPEAGAVDSDPGDASGAGEQSDGTTSEQEVI